MKTILMSIHPKWCDKIFSGEKTIEVRKTAPKPPFKVVVYCTKGNGFLTRYLGDLKHNKRLDSFLKNTDLVDRLNGKVIGEFICDKVYERPANIIYLESAQADYLDLLKKSCLTENDVIDYCGGNLKKSVCFLSISDLKIYDKPKELGEFYVYNKELEQRFLDGEDYCCHDATNEYGEALTECPADNIKNCYQCWEEWSGWCHRITRPPQSYMRIEEVTE